MEVDLSIYKVPDAPDRPPPPKITGGTGIGSSLIKDAWADFKTKDIPEDEDQWTTEHREAMQKYKPDTIKAMAAQEEYETIKKQKHAFDLFSQSGGSFSQLSKTDKQFIYKNVPAMAKEMMSMEKVQRSLTTDQLKELDAVTSGMGAHMNMISQTMAKTQDPAVRGDLYNQYEKKLVSQFGPPAKQLFDTVKKIIPPTSKGVMEWDDMRVGLLNSFGSMLMNYNTAPQKKTQDPLDYGDQSTEDLAKMIDKKTGDKFLAQQLRNGKSIEDLIITEENTDLTSDGPVEMKYIYVNGKKVPFSQFQQMMAAQGGQQPQTPGQQHQPSMNQGGGASLPGQGDEPPATITSFNRSATKTDETAAVSPADADAGAASTPNSKKLDAIMPMVRKSKLNDHDKKMAEYLFKQAQKVDEKKKGRLLQRIADMLKRRG